jgi:hypothetical protein
MCFIFWAYLITFPLIAVNKVQGLSETNYQPIQTKKNHLNFSAGMPENSVRVIIAVWSAFQTGLLKY